MRVEWELAGWLWAATKQGGSRLDTGKLHRLALMQVAAAQDRTRAEREGKPGPDGGRGGRVNCKE